MIMETFLTYFFVGGFSFGAFGICLMLLYYAHKIFSPLIEIIKDIMDELNNN